MTVKPEVPAGYYLGALHGKHHERERILALLADDSPIWDDPRGLQEALRAAIQAGEA